MNAVPFRRRLHVRLILLLSTVLVTAGGAWLALSLTLAEREFDRLIQSQFDAAVAITENSFGLLGQMAVIGATHLALDERLGNAICGEGLDGALSEALERFRWEIKADAIVVLDHGGRVRLHTGDPAQAGQSWGARRIVRLGLDERRSERSVHQDMESLIMYGAAPVVSRSGDDRLCGLALTGYGINDALLRGIGGGSPVAITVVRRRAIMATTFDALRDGGRSDIPFAFVDYQRWLESPGTIRRFRHEDRTYLARALPLPMMEPRMDGTMLLTQDQDQLEEIRTRLISLEGWTLILGILAVALLAGRFAARLLAPLRQLREFGRAALEGRAAEPIRIHRRDETGAVAEELNRLVEALRESNEALERRVAERTADLALANASLAEAQAIARLGHWSWDGAEGAGRWSEEARRILGRRPDAPGPIAAAFPDLVHPNDRTRVREYAEQAGREGLPGDIEYRLLLPGGILKHVHECWRVERGDRTGPRAVTGTIQDITDRVQDQERLRKLSRAVEQSHSPIVITDLGAHIEFANPAFTLATGYSLEETLGQNPRILKSGEQDAAFYRMLWDTLLRGDVWQGELHNRRKDGTLYWEFATISPVKDERGKTTHYVAVKEVITERKRVEAELLSAKEQAEAASQAKSAFLAGMSHELRTPLNGILGYAQILERDPVLGEDQRQGVAVIKRSGEHLLTLINDLLDLAKIEAGRFELETAPCDPRELLQGLADMFRMRTREKGIDFAFTIAAPLPARVEADARRLRQILINLLGNAVKFTEHGGVALRAGFVEGRLEVEVGDTGIGMAREDLQCLFQPFRQVGDKGYRQQGTGLGLAISKRLIDEMGGDIRVESAPGAGARFFLRLPLPELPGAFDPKPLAEAPATGYRRRDGVEGPLRILVVDDVPPNRAVLRLLLEPLGFRVEEAEGAVAALDAARETPPDLVLMDLAMPGIDGLEATRLFKADPGLAAIPVIACSARAYAEDRERSRQAGCEEHLPKPVQIGALLDTLGRWLPLEWVNGTGTASDGLADEGATPLTGEEREALLRHAKRGDIQQVRMILSAHPPGADQLLNQLHQAAERFDIKRIRAILSDAGE